MQKTIHKYLEECRDIAAHNLYCCSSNYLRTKPKDGKESEYASAKRDLEIADELIRLVEAYPTSNKPDAACDDTDTGKCKKNALDSIAIDIQLIAVEVVNVFAKHNIPIWLKEDVYEAVDDKLLWQRVAEAKPYLSRSE